MEPFFRVHVNTMEIKELYKLALEKWGTSAQVTQAMEECGELIAALNQYFFRERLTRADLASEIADVELMCEQLRVIIGDKTINKEKARKVRRLRKRLMK